MARKLWPALLLFLVAACVTARPSNDVDFSHTKTVRADGLKLRVPASFRKFTENDAVLFRPDPPVRPSPGVLVRRETADDVYRVLDAALLKVRDKMGGAPLLIKRNIAGRETLGLHDELVTHFIWIYAIESDGTIWTLQIVAPLSWTDEQALAFHDLVCDNLRITD